jgi:tetratricopeptide (TPR) repeat protein
MDEPASNGITHSDGRRLSRGWFVLFIAAVTVGMLIYANNWIAWTCLGAIAVLTAIFGCLIIVGLWRSTTLHALHWRAQQPRLLFVQGNQDAAEKSFQSTLKKVNEFEADDIRRGVALSEFGSYLELTGRHEEANRFVHEGLAILERHRVNEPVLYVMCLNNCALNQIDVRQYSRAQVYLEKAMDWLPMANKPTGKAMSLQIAQPDMEFVLHLNLATLFVAIEALPEARHHLHEAQALLETLSRRQRGDGESRLLQVRAQERMKSGDVDAAEKLCPMIELNARLPIELKVLLHRKQFHDAEKLLNPVMDRWMRSSRPPPVFLDFLLDYAESLFGQDLHENAFTAFQLARRIASSYRMAQDLAWRKTLETWLKRARDLEKHELAASLEAELQRMPAANQAITILDKLRIRPQTEE